MIVITREEFEETFGDYEPALKESLWNYLVDNYRKMKHEN